MTVVLSIETATPYLVLGLIGLDEAGRETIALESSERVERAHSELAVPGIESLLARAGGPLPTLLVVGTGPGSFTGVRVGASLALGLGRGWGASVVGVPTLEAIAATGPDGLVAVSLDARKGNVYGAVYRVAGGVVSEVNVGIEKRSREDFAALVPEGATHLVDAAPGGVGLARLAMVRGQPTPLELAYL
jgi:tRNA threonylcarbamoyladenosine biosynthesis protein TsaB